MKALRRAAGRWPLRGTRSTMFACAGDRATSIGLNWRIAWAASGIHWAPLRCAGRKVLVRFLFRMIMVFKIGEILFHGEASSYLLPYNPSSRHGYSI